MPWFLIEELDGEGERIRFLEDRIDAADPHEAHLVAMEVCNEKGIDKWRVVFEKLARRNADEERG